MNFVSTGRQQSLQNILMQTTRTVQKFSCAKLCVFYLEHPVVVITLLRERRNNRTSHDSTEWARQIARAVDKPQIAKTTSAMQSSRAFVADVSLQMSER